MDFHGNQYWRTVLDKYNVACELKDDFNSMVPDGVTLWCHEMWVNTGSGCIYHKHLRRKLTMI